MPLASGYGIKPLDPTIRTDMEVGAARMRVRTLARQDKITLSWLFTDAEMVIFRAWFDSPTGASRGAAWFSTNLKLGTGGVVAATVRFTSGTFQANLVESIGWQVSGEVEAR